MMTYDRYTPQKENIEDEDVNCLHQQYNFAIVTKIVVFNTFRFLVAINFGSGTETRKYTDTHDTIPEEADVELTTENGVKLQVGNTASLTSLELGPYQGVVLSWEYVAKEL